MTSTISTTQVSHEYNHRMAARLFGIFFILAFLSYGIGGSLVSSVTGAEDFLISVNDNKATLVVGVLLMAIVHSVVNIGLPVVLLPILKSHNRPLTYGYLSVAIAATTVLAVGAISLLGFIPLGEEFIKSGSADTHLLETLGGLLVAGGTYSYHIGMALWSIGGLMFVTVLYQSKLIPRLMSIWGALGYVTLLSGSILEIFAHDEMVEMISVIPGGLFEVTLSIWLIAKGFSIPKPEQYSQSNSASAAIA